MAGPKLDPQTLAHLEWLGFVRPTGLVVSAPALVRAGAILDSRDIRGQELLRGCLVADEIGSGEPQVAGFVPFAHSVLDWSFSPKAFAGMETVPVPSELELPLPDYGETLRPDFAVREPDAKEGELSWQLLVVTLESSQDFDEISREHGRLESSAHGRMERLLRHTGVSAGLLYNGRALRLISAPRGESSGWLDFRVADMVQTAGRPISTALRLLLSQTRLLTLPRAQRLAALLDDSRKYQNEVSERLAEQVLHSLYELLRGLQSAHGATKGELLRDPLAEHPDEVYRSLLTVILRLVFLLYAEERDMLPGDETYLRYYSLAGLHERLREEAALFPDTMDQRYGAWAQLLVLFRMVHDGADAGTLHLPKRHGVLFDPDRFPFLEGRTSGSARQLHEGIQPPLIPDGTIYRALEKLLVLDGERISYRALDVEQIGSVYETMMGFKLETATGRSVALKAQKKHGAPAAISLDELLQETAGKREKWIQDRTDRKLSATVKREVVAASTLEDLHAALLPIIDLAATPDLVPRGAMVLQPSEERRRSGSHYTPRALTEPIVRTTLEPVLAQLRGDDGLAPTPEQILELKVLDPAMGSGAFLVETCRQLGDALIEAWRAHDKLPTIPPDEDEVVYARRLVAQRCLYGVDRNPVAVDLAKVSLWLVTLAREHALTFVDHALRHGDSLVGLSLKQIEAFNWEVGSGQVEFVSDAIRPHLEQVRELRRRIREADEAVSDLELRDLWDQAEVELAAVRLLGDLVVIAFFEGKNKSERKAQRATYSGTVVSGGAQQHVGQLELWRHRDPPLAPFHWEIEFAEVFDRLQPGFDIVVGNPPFLGGSRISEVAGMGYFQWLRTAFVPCGHHCDLVAYFFRRSYDLLRDGGSLGLLATNTIAQGDTREGGLRTILRLGAQIYSARRRVTWPGQAAVVVSVVHISKAAPIARVVLDGHAVPRISAYLFQGTQDESPSELSDTPYYSLGSKIYGQGFLFADDDSETTPVSERARLIDLNPDWAERMPPYLGGDEVNSDPEHRPHRFVICLSDVQEESQLSQWPDLKHILETKVKPGRMILGSNPNNVPLKRRWWAYQAHRPGLYSSIESFAKVLVNSQVTTHLAFAFVPAASIFSHKLCVVAEQNLASFCVLQSRVHEVWARFLSSTLGDALNYSPSDCLGTFPFPVGWRQSTAFQVAGQTYYAFRAALMLQRVEGLTDTYNRFHDPDERDLEIVKLRELHADMDRAVLDAYGWSDIQTECEFLLDYEIDEVEWGNKKKPYRYRWPDDVRDEVLARLLELNAERARAERRAGAGGRSPGRSKQQRAGNDAPLFDGIDVTPEDTE